MAANEHLQVYACFESNWCDAPILRAILTAGRALVWRNEDVLNRFVVPFTLDYVRQPQEEQARMWKQCSGK